MSRRPTLSTLSMAALAGLCTLASGCADEAPSGPDAPPDPSALLRDGHTLAGLDAAVRAAVGNAVYNGEKFIVEVTDFGGSPTASQVAALSRQIGGFPTEGTSYLAISSGNAAMPDAPAHQNTTFGGDPLEPGRWDEGGLEIRLAMPPGSRYLSMDVRYFSWDASPSLDPARITVTYTDTLASGEIVTPTVLLREYTTATELYRAGGTGYGTLGFGPLRSEEFDARRFRGDTITLRLEAGDSGYGSFDSGLLVDNIRVVNAQFADWSGPVTYGTTITATPVPIDTEFRVVSTIVDRGVTVARIKTAEYSIDDGPWTPMTTVGSRTDSSAIARLVHPGIATPGVYTLCVRGQDTYGNVGRPQCLDHAVYDPAEATTMTGSGAVVANWGSFPAQYDMRGRADFSFSVSYRPRLNGRPPVLTGGAAFYFADELERATLRFTATELAYLMVDGGTKLGRIVGKGRLFRDDVLVKVGSSPLHAFLISGVDVDGKLRPAGDKLRIKVWEPATGRVVLDTEMGEGFAGNDPSSPYLAETIVPHTRTVSGGFLLKHTITP